METQRITIQGVDFNAPAPFTTGYVLEKDGEVHALNQVLGENLRNNFAKKVKEAKEKAETDGGEVDVASLQSEFDEYAASYEFGIRKAGGGDASLPKDPIQRMAHTIARDKIREHAKAQGKKLSPEQVASLVPQLLERSPQIVEEAVRRVAAQSEISIEELELPEPETAPAEESGEAKQTEGEEVSRPSRRKRG